MVAIVDACVLNRSAIPTIVGTMGDRFRLPNHIDGRTLTFEKDNVTVQATEHIYEVTNVSGLYSVWIRFLTCTDEGVYTIGDYTFRLRVRADTCGVFYYTVKPGLMRSLLIEPLDGVLGIYRFHVQPDGAQLWNLGQVWNNTMDRVRSPCYGCFIVNKGRSFGVSGDESYRYFMYSRQGTWNMTCSSVHNQAIKPATESATQTTASSRSFVPDLPKLQDVKTYVELQDVNSGVYRFYIAF